MERKITFEKLWEQEEQKAVLERLQREYPVWMRHRKQRRTVLAAVVVVVAVLSPLPFLLSPSKCYDHVACNRSGIADAHWAEVAGNILISNCKI